MKFEWQNRGVLVTTLEVDWDLFSILVEDGTVSQVDYDLAQLSLTVAARAALETKEPLHFYGMAEKFSDLGACDTEPRSQFAVLWMKAYGEDIY